MEKKTTEFPPCAFVLFEFGGLMKNIPKIQPSEVDPSIHLFKVLCWGVKTLLYIYIYIYYICVYPYACIYISIYIYIHDI